MIGVLVLSYLFLFVGTLLLMFRNRNYMQLKDAKYDANLQSKNNKIFTLCIKKFKKKMIFNEY